LLIAKIKDTQIMFSFFIQASIIEPVEAKAQEQIASSS